MKDVKEGIEKITDFVFHNSDMAVGQKYTELRQMIETLLHQSNLRDRIETCKELLALDQAKTKEGEYMFDFEKLLQQQIQALEAQLKEGGKSNE